MRGVEETAIAFARACDEAAVSYALIGGFAVIAWGQPRTTQDVDVLLILDPHQVRGFHEALAKQGLDASEADFFDALRERSHVTILDASSHFHVDARAVRDAMETDQVRSAAAIDFKGQTIRVARPEETVAFKLKFGSEQDLQDARSILIRQEGRLDMQRLRALAKKLGVEPSLDELSAL